MTKPTTKPSTRPKQQTGALKALLLTGSLVATLAGARLLALQETGTTDTAVTFTAPVTVIVPAAESSTIPLPPTGHGVQVQLRAIPQVVQPQIQPVARSQSSQ